MTFKEWLKTNNEEVAACNCGGPQDGTDHSPDCDYELSAIELWEEYIQDWAEDKVDDQGNLVS